MRVDVSSLDTSADTTNWYSHTKVLSALITQSIKLFISLIFGIGIKNLLLILILKIECKRHFMYSVSRNCNLYRQRKSVAPSSYGIDCSCCIGFIMRFWSYDTLKVTVTLSLISTRQLDIALIGSFKIAVVEADRLTPIMEIPIVHCYELIYHRQLPHQQLSSQF